MCSLSNDIIFREADPIFAKQMTDIYNESVRKKNITADTTEVSEEYFLNWLKKHDQEKWPAWIMQIKESKSIIGFCSLNFFYPRPAYDITAEISLYISEKFVGQGLGSLALNFIESEAQKRGMLNLLAFVFASNIPARKLFEKNGYISQGYFPNLALIENEFRTLIILQKKIKHE